MSAAEALFEKGVPGIFEARQVRSIKSRDGFIQAGIDALNTKHFDELKISDLAEASGNSVGSFYTRFQDKDAFFNALRLYSVDAIARDISSDFTADSLHEKTPGEALDCLVDLMGAIFSSRYRGVFRESWPFIMDANDSWAPFRTHAQSIVKILHEGLEGSFPEYDQEETKTRLSFCFQLIVGVLQNDLVNDYHVFKLRDGTVLPGLKETLRAYMNLPMKDEG